MPVIIVNGGGGGGGGDGHTHSNLADLNTLATPGPGQLKVSDVPIQGETAQEVPYQVTLSPAQVSARAIELPYDCDPTRPVEVHVWASHMVEDVDWELEVNADPIKDRVKWAGLALDGKIQPGDTVSITYYKKL